MDRNVKAQPPSSKPLRSKLWMAYFFFTIAAIGIPVCVLMVLPLALAAFIFPICQRWADRALYWGVWWLMKMQPWLQADIQLAIPSGGALLASNHRSHLDVFLLLSRIPGIRVLAKHTLFYIPLLNVMMLASRQIPTRRGRVDSFWRAMKIMRQRLTQGETVHVFPEMTRCTRGFSGTQEFLTAPFLAAKESGRQVIPIVIQGTDDVWPRQDFSIYSHQRIRVRTLPALNPQDFPTAEALRDATRNSILKAMS